MILGLFAKVSGKFLLKNYSCGTISATLKHIVFPPFTLIFNHTSLRYEENFRVYQSQTAGNGFFRICVFVSGGCLRVEWMEQRFANT